MSSINNIGHNNPIHKIVSKPIEKSIPTDAPKQLPATDKLELSGAGQFLQSLKNDKDVRADKVADIKALIAQEKYEDDAKLEGALDGLLDDLLKE